jgi:molybdenum cofactor cytidylyltransferase
VGGELTAADVARPGSVTGIVLAAGTSSRLGRPKQLLDLGGKPVLQHVLDAAAASTLDQIVLVLGHGAEEVAAKVRMPARGATVVNLEFAEGQATSLRAGLRAANPDAAAAVFLLGDQPGIRPRAIGAVVAAWRAGSGPAVQAAYEGRPAHPTLFDRSVWPELEGAVGDEGARGVLAAHPEWRSAVEVGGSPPEDIDTEEDYARVKVAFERTRRPGTGNAAAPQDP